MTIIYESRFGRTLDALVARFCDAKGQSIEAWVFDDETSRRQAEEALGSRGVEARFRSAYKPLLHFFLEEVDLSALSAIHIVYPIHPACPGNRFLLEAYPLAALVGDIGLSFEAGDDSGFFYAVTLTAKDGSSAIYKVFAPNRAHTDFIGETLLSPTGWLALGGADGERLETDYEAVFSSAVQAIADHDWGASEPYFEELNIAVTLPIHDRRLPFGEEVISLREAMHEDIYFSLLEIFQRKSGRPVGDRGLQPGQIVPEVRFGDIASARVEIRPLSGVEAEGKAENLAEAAKPIFAAQMRSELARIDGLPFNAFSRIGRKVEARYHQGSDRPIMISGGQHPNETTGIIGALRAAQELAKRPGAHFTVAPLQNPDGYEIHQRLRVDNPTHMHHAARYTALGDDLEYRADTSLLERAVRVEAERLTGAALHLNLHGYPAHEWTRPLSGYVPRGFAMWTLPRGFFLIMHHHAAWAPQAEQLLDGITRRLAAMPGLVEYNNAQIRLFETHAGETGFHMVNDIPCIISADERYTVPLTIITEYPDETIYGDAFVAGHTAQMETVLAAYDTLQTLELAEMAAV